MTGNGDDAADRSGEPSSYDLLGKTSRPWWFFSQGCVTPLGVSGGLVAQWKTPTYARRKSRQTVTGELAAMKALNYRHLRYFYMVAKAGGVSAAARSLNVAQPTVSTQIKQFERDLGVVLFEPMARGVGLTPVGRVVLRYAQNIFALGDELLRSLTEGDWVKGRRIRIGISSLLPKMIIPGILKPAWVGPDSAAPELTFQVGSTAHLADELNRGVMDVVLTDSAEAMCAADIHVRHLGSSRVLIFGTRDVVNQLGPSFPGSLDGAPFLMPSRGSSWGQALESWFARVAVKPRVVGEFDDNAIMKNFGRLGVGLFPGLASVSAEISHQYAVDALGFADGVEASVYALTRRTAAADLVLSQLLSDCQLSE